MSDTLEECERLGHEKRFVDGLTAALAGADTGAPPGRVAALPADRVGGAPTVPHRPAAQEDVAFVRCDRTAPTEATTAVAARLAAVRIGVLRQLSEHVVDHLGGRLSGGEPILRKQLVQATVADGHTELEAARRRLRVAADVPAAVADLHDRLTALDWELARLLGASGFLSDGGARASYVARLAAHCWTPRRTS
ncbi:acyl-CoA dehydrogenase family protein [Pseudonocardia endophytica]|uniref:Acyl-CoA dehydrogenase-like protein n=1 Tax=Pseudonocardia endophytica TaxID=401976 RepID=A0A4R1HR99_PSEEN|nr:acyl-CoA dehydrogenase family protein [Pseudonocardia endophytica]TCK22299.1 acyl-CoA dehydrogenase-like protein [Pseudonocardia endophytica]